jgi:TonB family protein
MFPGPWYYPARYLHRRPTPLKPIWPAYPEALTEVEGRVTILLLINEAGTVDQYRILASEPSDLFDMSVIAAFTAAQYAPALITGYKVKSQLLAEVSFKPGAPPVADFSIMEPAKPIQDASKSLGKEN